MSRDDARAPNREGDAALFSPILRDSMLCVSSYAGGWVYFVFVLNGASNEETKVHPKLQLGFAHLFYLFYVELLRVVPSSQILAAESAKTSAPTLLMHGRLDNLIYVASVNTSSPRLESLSAPSNTLKQSNLGLIQTDFQVLMVAVTRTWRPSRVWRGSGRIPPLGGKSVRVCACVHMLCKLKM